MPFETLTYLAHGYFHQDYDLLAATPSDLVRVFVAKEDPETLEELRRDLDQLLATDPSEEEVRALWLGTARSSYDPVLHGSSFLGWIRQVREIVAEPS
ncbi:contact-dependent growth inhibition system immunity protein [Micromonospora arborensis]|uniref:contact-dependent growth inhibition system immunity protein n=1 Tax=Micromonospora arborensis TaxID=2116518 RepID=UPI0037200C10